MRRVVLLAICLLLGAAPSAVTATPVVAPDTESVAQVDWAGVPEYRIVPGDELLLDYGPTTVTGIARTQTIVVRPDGRVTIYPVGDLVAAGRTPLEVQADLLRLLSVELKQPRVTIAVSKLAGNEVHVLGRVKRPGSYPVGPFSTLLQALAAAGGFEDDAARNSVLVMHRAGASNVRVARVKADRLLKGAGDVPLSRFDIVYVPRSTIGNVDVFVQQFFTGTVSAVSYSILGWELFHLNRVVVLPSTSSSSQ